MHSLAIIPVATCVLRTELLQLHQERDEAFRAFAVRVRGKAKTCAYMAVCEYGNNIDYTDHIIHDVLLNRIDSDIRHETLGIPDILTKPVYDEIAVVENKEMAHNALPSSTLSAMSSLQRLRRNPQRDPARPQSHLTGLDMPRTWTVRACLSSSRRDLVDGMSSITRFRLLQGPQTEEATAINQQPAGRHGVSADLQDFVGSTPGTLWSTLQGLSLPLPSPPLPSSITALGITIPLHTGEQWSDESLATREIRLIYIQPLLL